MSEQLNRSRIKILLQALSISIHQPTDAERTLERSSLRADPADPSPKVGNYVAAEVVKYVTAQTLRVIYAG
jgi:hypothetical protein